VYTRGWQVCAGPFVLRYGLKFYGDDGPEVRLTLYWLPAYDERPPRRPELLIVTFPRARVAER